MTTHSQRPTRRPAWRAGEGLEDPQLVLPHVVVTVSDTGLLNVRLDGQPFEPPQGAEPWTRSGFGDLLDAITHDRSLTVRVEVRESDGSVFTDIIRARKPPTPPEGEPGPATGRHAGRGRGRRGDVEVTGVGFSPNERVAVALLITHVEATSTGEVQTLVNYSDARGGDVLLVGRASGTVRVSRVP